MKKLIFLVVNCYFLASLGIMLLELSATIVNQTIWEDASSLPPWLLFTVIPANTLFLFSLALWRKLMPGKSAWVQQFSMSITAYSLVLLPFIIGMTVLNLGGSIIPIEWHVVLLIGLYLVVWGVHIWNRKKELPRWQKSITIVVLTLALASLSLFLYVVVEEWVPRTYLEFPLNDPNGTYILNYDGDYWLTYYLPGPDGVPVKKGNTAITHTPVPLDTYLGMPVEVDGVFQPIQGPIYGADKRFCVKDQCINPSGPGTWYASPLKIQTIIKK